MSHGMGGVERGRRPRWCVCGPGKSDQADQKVIRGI